MFWRERSRSYIVARKAALALVILLSFLNPNSVVADISDDLNYVYGQITKRSCLDRLVSTIARNHEVSIIILGDSFIPPRFIPKNHKQERLKLLASLGKKNINLHSNHKSAFIFFLDIRNNGLCPLDWSRIRDPILSDVIRRSDQARSQLIKRIKNDQATYLEVKNFFEEENKISEELEKLMPDDKLQDLNVYRDKKVYDSLNRFTRKFENILKVHYDVELSDF